MKTVLLATAAALTFSAGAAFADEQAPAPAAPAAAPAPMPMAPSLQPAMTAPLSQNSSPLTLDLGPLGSKVYITGAVSGLAYAQSNPVSGDHDAFGDLGNAQIFINKSDGEFQYFIDVGAYSLPALGTLPYTKATTLTTLTYDVVPIAFAKWAPAGAPGFSIQAGKLPTLIGDEYMYTVQNSNIARGLLWGVEPLVSRGVQVNYTTGPVTVNVAFTDGFYSNDFNTISGALTYVVSPTDTVIVQGEGNTEKDTRVSATTLPIYNNEQIFDVIWTHTMGQWSFTPYFQYTHAPAFAKAGWTKDTDTWGGALLATYTFDPKGMAAGWSVPMRVEYIAQSNGAGVGVPLFGAGSNAWSVTATPTYTFNRWFARGEVSYVGIGGGGSGYGSTGTKKDQVRGMLELGFLF
ncbi:MAG: outer membrane beta-barrel protein [Caulobacteraceae bacterium]